MSKLRQAAEAALEALENTSPLGFNMESDKKFFAAITALKAALAEPVQEPEPAGWFEGPFGEFRANQLFKHSWPASSIKWSIPLFIHQNQHQPLPVAASDSEGGEI